MRLDRSGYPALRLPALQRVYHRVADLCRSAGFCGGPLFDVESSFFSFLTRVSDFKCFFVVFSLAAFGLGFSVWHNTRRKHASSCVGWSVAWSGRLVIVILWEARGCFGGLSFERDG